MEENVQKNVNHYSKTVEKYVLFGPVEGSSLNKSKTEKRTYLVRNIKKEKDEKHGNDMVKRR